MDRLLKIINILLLSIVGMLLLIGVMVLVQGSKVDLGKIADWWAGLSAVATVGTFAVAVIVLRKAPNWFKQKRNETGFNHVISLMLEYDGIEQKIQRLYFDVASIRRNDPNFDSLWNEIRTVVYTIIVLRSKLQSCKRWNINASPEVDNVIIRLKDFCSLSLKVLTCEKLRDLDKLAESQNNLLELKNNISTDAQSFKTDIGDIFGFPE